MALGCRPEFSFKIEEVIRNVAKEIKFDVGDLVTYRKDLLGVKGFNGIVTKIFCEDEQWYAMIKWLDGCEHPELFRHIQLLAKAKDERDDSE